MLIANKFEMPDDCPENCPHKDEPFYQGNTCHRCPVFNCRKIPDEFGHPFSLIEPENYREDWAAEWVDFFKDLENKK